MKNSELSELNALAHKIAYEATAGLLTSASSIRTDKWLEIFGDEANYAEELHYLDLRGLLVRNGNNPRLFRILDSEVKA